MEIPECVGDRDDGGRGTPSMAIFRWKRRLRGRVLPEAARTGRLTPAEGVAAAKQGDFAMARARRTLDRKTLRDQGEAAERRKKGEETVETEEEEEDDDDDDDDDDEEAEGEEGEEAEGSGDEDEEAGDEDDEDRPKPKKKKVVKPKPVKVPKVTKSRSRTAKIVRMKIVWGVFSNSHQVIEEFDYPHKKDAEELAAKLTADKKSGHPFFLQPIKKPMEKEKEKEK
jgi:hypothetical protein